MSIVFPKLDGPRDGLPENLVFVGCSWTRCLLDVHACGVASAMLSTRTRIQKWMRVHNRVYACACVCDMQSATPAAPHVSNVRLG